MISKSDFRFISLKILDGIFDKRQWLSDAVDEYAGDVDGEHKDMKKVYELVYGILRNKNLIDYNLSFYFQKMPESTSLCNILRVGFYQLVYMDSIPDYAAINTAVELVKATGHKNKAGFINGVLRNVARNNDKNREVKIEGRLAYLSVKYSYEKWMVEFLGKYYKDDAVEKILAACNEKPPVFFRVNTLATTVEKLQADLEATGVKTKRDDINRNCLMVETGDAINNDLFKNGMYFIQDLSSQMMGFFAATAAGETIIDVGSAPGGKALYMAQEMENRGLIIAVEPDKERIKLLQENMARIGTKNIEIKNVDATREIKEFGGIADKVIVDAPCSGLGVIRRHPEKKWILSETEMKKFPELQLKILQNSGRWAKSGGSLFYSTCTFNPEENEILVERFLNENKDYEIADIFEGRNQALPIVHDFRKGKYFLSLPGNSRNMDGFFAAKMNKK